MHLKKLLKFIYHTVLHRWYSLINDGGSALAHSVSADCHLMHLAEKPSFITDNMVRVLGHLDAYAEWQNFHASNDKQMICKITA